MASTNLPLAAASAAIAAGGDLLQIAYEGDLGCRSLDEDTIPQLADALKMTIEHAVDAGMDLGADPAPDLLAKLQIALTDFLAGWA